MIERLQETFSNFNDNERRLLGFLGVVILIMLVGLPVFFFQASMSDLEAENEAMRDVLSDINEARPELAIREAEREAAAARYRNEPPPLGSFLEERAREEDLTINQVTDQPVRNVGDFERRNTRVTIPNVQLRPAIKLLTSIVNSQYPVAIERLEIELRQRGEDNQVNVEVGVVAFAMREDMDEDE